MQIGAFKKNLRDKIKQSILSTLMEEEYHMEHRLLRLMGNRPCISNLLAVGVSFWFGVVLVHFEALHRVAPMYRNVWILGLCILMYVLAESVMGALGSVWATNEDKVNKSHRTFLWAAVKFLVSFWSLAIAGFLLWFRM